MNLQYTQYCLCARVALWKILGLALHIGPYFHTPVTPPSQIFTPLLRKSVLLRICSEVTHLEIASPDRNLPSPRKAIYNLRSYQSVISFRFHKYRYEITP